jgi:hypothetical protein
MYLYSLAMNRKAFLCHIRAFTQDRGNHLSLDSVSLSIVDIMGGIMHLVLFKWKSTLSPSEINDVCCLIQIHGTYLSSTCSTDHPTAVFQNAVTQG